MKSIVRITRRLMSLFLVLVASSMMFLSSPAIAGTVCWVTVTDENFKTEVIEAGKNKPVIVILADESDNYLIETKAKAEKFYGDGYKVVVGRVGENREVFDKTSVISVKLYPPPPIILGSKNGKLTIGTSLVGESGFELTKNSLNNLS